MWLETLLGVRQVLLLLLLLLLLLTLPVSTLAFKT
jgi:hypothetical protein